MQLGFGCSDLLGDKTRAEGVALLNAAYDAGIRHFDVAPMYGFGDAEGLVGEFCRGKARLDLTITTKFGLEPMVRSAGAKRLVSVARQVMRASPLARKLVRQNAYLAIQGGRFDVDFAQRSLEASLKSLQTDVIDYYLLHECQSDHCTLPLYEFLERACSAGKIRHFGIGTSIAATVDICTTAPEYSSVVQIKNTVLEPVIYNIPDADKRQIITYGALTILPNIPSSHGLPQSDLAGLILQHAMLTNPNGIVLFRSSSAKRIEENVRAATERVFSPEQFNELNKSRKMAGI